MLPKFQGQLNTRGWEKFSIFDWSRRLSRKRYDICPWMLWNVNKEIRKPIDPCQFRDLEWPWKAEREGSKFSGES